MFSINEKTTLLGLTDLRTEAQGMLEALKYSRVIITERNTPRAVVLDYAAYQRMQDLIALAEEGIDAETITKRKKKGRRFLTHDQVLRKLTRK